VKPVFQDPGDRFPGYGTADMCKLERAHLKIRSYSEREASAHLRNAFTVPGFLPDSLRGLYMCVPLCGSLRFKEEFVEARVIQ
jgi:hypothetical protein